MKPSFTKARFLTSAAKAEQFPKKCYPEIAFVGRSNVGKSSLINHLCRQKRLAKVSSTPGKTQLVNFFIVDEALTLVDLPGYGFAKAPRTEKAKWTEAIDHYLEGREALLLVLIDIRREPTPEDYALIEWATHYERKILLVCTKTDKLSPHAIATRMNEIKVALGIKHAVPYSIKDGSARTALITAITKSLLPDDILDVD